MLDDQVRYIISLLIRLVFLYSGADKRQFSDEAFTTGKKHEILHIGILRYAEFKNSGRLVGKIKNGRKIQDGLQQKR